ncbi:forkhead box protein J1-B [Trichonephila clavipes]|nr:forkhead box protein J1-B [Trichonephila clavipes]
MKERHLPMTLELSSAMVPIFAHGFEEMTFKMPIVSKDEMALRFHQNWREQNPEVDDSGTVDDCLTDLNWLQNLNIMTKFGTPTPETPPASPVPSPESKGLLFSCGAVERPSKGTKVPFCSKPPAVEDVDYKTNGTVKPPYSYATLICMAMKANKNKMTLSAIYKWIKENFMYYRNADPSWQMNYLEIRLNLMQNDERTKIGSIGCFFERTATAGSDVVQSGRPIFDDFFQHLWPYIGNNTANVVFQMAYPHRPMTLHSPTENSLAVLNRKILEANSQVQNVKLGGHQTCLSINRLWHELCDMLRRLVGTTAPGHHDCSIQK